MCNSYSTYDLPHCLINEVVQLLLISMPKLTAQAKSDLDGLLSAYPKDLPGTVIGVVNKEGKILYLSSTGPRLFGKDDPARPDDVGSYM